MKWKNMRYLRLLIGIVVLPIFSQAQFRVVGYILMGSNMVEKTKALRLEQLTHLNIAFINPEGNGGFLSYPVLDTVISLAHQHHVKVFLSCGGGSRHEMLDTLLNDRNRNRVVDNFMNFMDRYHFDGLDVDIENDDINENYEPFVFAIGNRLHKVNKKISAALSYATREKIPASSLAMYDFINIMAYDKTAPWRPDEPGQHSPYDLAVSQIEYWGNERNVPKKKLVIGVPFYGYGFGPSGVKSMTFEDIVQAYPGSENKDETKMEDGGTMYYNGFAMIRKKTRLALEKTGGIMIWQLFGDAKGEQSLLSQITREIQSKGKQ